MRKVNINLWQKSERGPHRLVGLSLYDYEGNEELRKLVRAIEESLSKNFPGIEVNRGRAVRELFGE